mmetsp:Transcript_31959/g.71975  ORF Transcript_31959/g.71975 Transcript_31959/m.71975 type:complete len:214 (-) Transcript_31959:1145-1786(-)
MVSALRPPSAPGEAPPPSACRSARDEARRPKLRRRRGGSGRALEPEAPRGTEPLPRPRGTEPFTPLSSHSRLYVEASSPKVAPISAQGWRPAISRWQLRQTTRPQWRQWWRREMRPKPFSQLMHVLVNQSGTQDWGAQSDLSRSSRSESIARASCGPPKSPRAWKPASASSAASGLCTPPPVVSGPPRERSREGSAASRAATWEGRTGRAPAG